MRTKCWTTAFAVAACTVLLAGCPQPGGITEPFIDSVGWYFENIDQHYWTSDPPSNTAFVSFQVRVLDIGLLGTDFASIAVSNGDRTWEWSPDEIQYDSATRRIYLRRLWSSTWAAHTMRICDWAIEITLVNEYADMVTLDCTPPGSAEPEGGIVAVYTEDYSESTSGMVPMIPRAAVTGGANDGTDLTVAFTTTEANVYNCVLWLYDATDYYVGRSDYGVDWTTGDANSSVLSSGALDVAGGENVFHLQQSDIRFAGDSIPLSEIATARIVLTDGAQYATDGWWDYRSISAAVPF